jgi:hypothetical protein
METAEFVRFNDYVRRTTRPSAQLKRMGMFSLLCGRTFTSIAGLVKAVGGNSKDQSWLAQALKIGEVVRTNEGALTVPDAREEAKAQMSIAHQMKEIGMALDSFKERFPLWTKALERADKILWARYDQLFEAEDLAKSNPEMSFKQWLLQVEHEICTGGGGHCSDENCPGRFR